MDPVALPQVLGLVAIAESVGRGAAAPETTNVKGASLQSLLGRVMVELMVLEIPSLSILTVIVAVSPGAMLAGTFSTVNAGLLLVEEPNVRGLLPWLLITKSPVSPVLPQTSPRLVPSVREGVLSPSRIVLPLPVS